MQGADERREEGGPPNQKQWALAFEDAFDSGSLDTSNWGIGWGWGRKTSMSPTQVTEENVNVRDEKLRLKGTHDGDRILAGGVHTKDLITFEQGSYFEARIKFAGREGFQNAFWAKPNSEAWPPEIDVVELWQDGNGKEDTHESQHNLHYATSTKPNDRSAYANIASSHKPGDNLTDNFHNYGVHWGSNHISHFVDGKQVAKSKLDPMLATMTNGVPFYMMLSLNINNIGTADTSETWDEEVVIDWVRVWERR